MTQEDKEYKHNGKTIKIIPAKRVKKTPVDKETTEGEEGKVPKVKKPKKTAEEKGMPKYALGNKVALKNTPAEYAGAGFGESVVIKVFKSTYDQNYRYTIRGSSGQELPMLKAEQLKPAK